jgi:two-component system, cell cycle response regulator DivK
MKKILIVEDNKDSSEILGLFVTKLGHQVIKASNSQEAITYTEAECPDLIFMDLDLPDTDGIKTTAILRKNPKTSHIPVVAITAWISALWEEKALRVGIETYLIKPVSPQTLKETIEQYTKRSVSRGKIQLAFCLSLFLGLAVVTQGQAENYYIYQAPNGELIISNKQPPPGSKILPGVTDREEPQAQVPDKPQANGQPEIPPKSSKDNRSQDETRLIS